MPGLRYNHEIIAGPWEGLDCRILEQPILTPEFVKVKIREGEEKRTIKLFPLIWLKRKNGHHATERRLSHVQKRDIARNARPAARGR